MPSSAPMTDQPAPRAGFLDWVERVGDRLPDPVFIFAWLILALVGASVICAALGVTAINPVTQEALVAKSLLSAENIRTLLLDMPKTFSGFPPLGMVLLVMLGAGLAERVGLLSAVIRNVVRATPRVLLTPVVILLGLLSNHAADAGFVVLIPLAAVAFAAAGRHPLAGVAAAFAAVVGAFAGNPLPGQFDALILGFTEPAARLIDPSWTVNMVGNWWFTAASALIFVPVGWWVTEKVVEPRLGVWTPPEDHIPGETPLSAEEKKGLVWAALAAIAVIATWAALALMPGAPLVDPQVSGPARLTPFFRSLVAAFFVLFLTTGTAFGAATGAIKSHRDVVRLMSESMAGMAPYVVLAFAAAHFIAMFTWSNLGAITAINGAEGLKATGLPLVFFIAAIVPLAAFLDMFIGSASAKWAALGPVLVPMLMLLGVSPEMTTAAYRMGDSTVNMASPLNPYFALILGFCQRWKPGFGVGGLIAAVLPFSIAFMIAGLLLTGAWAVAEWPTGPGAPFHYAAPAAR
ncbi:MAG: AbgT family transporter [Caulobacteraceae bacterium]|nr:AbgT family transporter [Caulobacteraceae bacterium]